MALDELLTRQMTRRDALRRLAAAASVAPLAGAPAVLGAPTLGGDGRRQALTTEDRPLASTTMPSANTFDSTVPRAWFGLMLRLVRGTPGYTPPVASRAIGCAGIALYEAIVPGMRGYRSLAASITDLPAQSEHGRSAPAGRHWPSVANAALARVMRDLFPTAPASLRAEIDRLEADLSAGVPRGILQHSAQRGREVAEAILDWARTDGGHGAYLNNFPTDYAPPEGAGLWVPTPPAFQRALQPYWGANRPMALRSAAACDPGAHPAFSTDPGSAFFAEALEVYDTVNGLTSEQIEIARFWADDPGLTATPPGHSLSIVGQVLQARDASLAEAAEAYAKVGIAVCDAFIACWQTKYVYNLLRPITYIRRHIDPSWGDPLPVGTPPFPEYTSGHSVQSGATATVLTALFGRVRFTDHTHDARGFAPRTFDSFDDFADEAAISRLYGGIHYRAAIEQGLAQGRCVGDAVVRIRTRA